MRIACGASWLGSVAVASMVAIQYRLWLPHPWGKTFVAAGSIAILGTISCLFLGLWRIIRGPGRLRCAAIAFLGLIPAAVASAVVARGIVQYRSGQIAPTVPFVCFAVTGVSIGEVEAPLVYPGRMESDHLVMFHDRSVADPQGDVDAMEAHVSELERLTGKPLRAKIHWIRGSLLGQRNLSLFGLALGSPEGPAGHVDRHELAHAVLFQRLSPEGFPPMLLNEGWAESRSWDRATLKRSALWTRDILRGSERESEADIDQVCRDLNDPEGFRRLFSRARQVGSSRLRLLRELTDSFWYARDRGPVYSVGGAFCEYLVRRFGAERFVALVVRCRPGEFERACREVLGVDLDSLEAEFWRDVEAGA